MFSKLKEFIAAHPLNKNLLGIIAILIVLAVLPLIVIVSQQQQETRQHASGPISPPALALSPTPMPLLASTIVNLSSRHSSVPEGSAEVIVDVVSYNFSIQLANVSLHGNLNNLKPNTIYEVMLCWKYGGCSTRTTPEILTDNLGNVIFEDVEFGIYNRDDNPVNNVIVLEVISSGQVPPNACYLMDTPCLKGYYSIPSITPPVTPSSEPTAIPTAISSPTISFPSPSPVPTTSARSYQRVFVTSTTYNGNLGGLAGADAKCQERANAASLGGSWKAWLSDSLTSASARLTHHNNPYRLLNGTILANNWSDLTDGTLQNNIDLTESYASLAIPTWTNTLINGDIRDKTSHCGNWTSTSGMGARGSTGYTDSLWTVSGFTSCTNNLPLFCFEQSESPSPTPTSITRSSLSLNLSLEGIGVSVANRDNNNPLNKTRTVNIELIPISRTAQSKIPSFSSIATFDNKTGNFIGTVDLGNIRSGRYNVGIKINKYLKKNISINIIPGKISSLPKTQLLAGDVNNDNKINDQDGKIIFQCLNKTSIPCINSSDLNDNGKVDYVDYNLYLRNAK